MHWLLSSKSHGAGRVCLCPAELALEADELHSARRQQILELIPRLDELFKLPGVRVNVDYRHVYVELYMLGERGRFDTALG